MRAITTSLVFCIVLLSSHVALGQITQRRPLGGTPQNVSRLEEQLINGLRATRNEQQQFLRNIAGLANRRILDQRLVNAVYIWAKRRQPYYPFPFFERGIRIEAQKRNVLLPPVALVNRAGTLQPPQNLNR